MSGKRSYSRPSYEGGFQRSVRRRTGGGAPSSSYGGGGSFRGRRASHKDPELKFYDTLHAEALVPASGFIDPSLNLVPQGTGEEARIGRKFTVRKLAINMTTRLNTTANVTEGGDIVRFIVYQDKQTNGAAATVGDILQFANIMSHNNLSNKNRFRILMNKCYTVNATAATSTATFEMQGFDSHYLEMNIPIEMTNTAGNIAEVRSNNIGILLISDTGRLHVGYRTRIRFSDE